MQKVYLPDKTWKKLHHLWLDYSKLNGFHQLIWSLEEDGRFYGAEFTEDLI